MDDRFDVEFTDMEEDERNQWFWDFRKQVLFSSDKKSRKLQCLLSLNQGEKKQYNRIIKYKNKVIAIPVTANDILFYDTIKNISIKHPLPGGIWNKDAQKKGKFGRGIIWNKYLILLPSWSNIICKVDIEQESIVDVKDISNTGIKTSRTIPFSNAILDNEYIYMTAGEESALIIINAQTLEYTKKEFSDYKKGFSAIIKHGELYWLFPRYRDAIIKWNPETDEEKRYLLPKDLMAPSDKIGFNSAQRIGDHFWLFPAKAPKVVKIDARRGDIGTEEALKKYSNYKKDTDSFVKYWMTKTEGTFLKFYSAIQGVVVQYDTEKNSIQELPFYLSGEDKHRYFVDVECALDYIFDENMSVDLSEYLKIIEERKLSSGELIREPNGKKIYQKIMDLEKRETFV